MLVTIVRTTLVRRLVSRSYVASGSTIGNTATVTMSAQTTADELISGSSVAVFSKSYCPYCVKVKKLFDTHKITYKALELDKMSEGDSIQTYLKGKTGQSTVPSVWIGGKFIGGCDDTHALAKNGKLKTMLDEASISYASL